VQGATLIDPLGVPLAHFDFKYRTKGMYCICLQLDDTLIMNVAGLQSLYIIPRTPSPAPPEEVQAPPVARPYDEMTDEQLLDELQRRRKVKL